MHNALLAIHADVRFGPEKPLLAFPCLVHRQVALSTRVLGGWPIQAFFWA